MSLYVLSSKYYEDNTKDYGDCIVVINNGSALIYDCGSEAHAKEVIKLLNKNNIAKADCILSHNDDDHYDGFSYLIDNDKVNKFFTVDVKKHKEAVLKELNDGRRNKNSVGNRIDEIYDNIKELSSKINIYDIYSNSLLLPSFVKFIGPTKNYFVQTAAKGINDGESDNFDKTSFTNASSIQVEIDLSGTKVLLTGDCAINAIPSNVYLGKYDYIQIPHHGNEEAADDLIERVGKNNDIAYLISDNKGNANGGSDNLMTTKLYKTIKAKNTKDDTITIPNGSTTKNSYIPRATMGL